MSRSWKKSGEEKRAPARRGPKFEIRESKDKKPYAMISGTIVKRGRGGASVMLFPSKFKGSFGGLMVSGWRGAAIPIQDADQIDITDSEIVFSFPWLTVAVDKKVVDEDEFIEFLNYVADMPREEYTPKETAAPEKKKRSWKR